jgi:glucose/arabinose dehydrogenase
LLQLVARRRAGAGHDACMKKTRRRILVLAAAAAAALAACGGGGGSSGSGSEGPVAAPPIAPVAATAVAFATGLNQPWGMAFLPDGRIVVTEKAGRMRIVSADGRTVSAPLTGLPSVDSGGQGGLLDVAVARDFATSRRLFFTFAERGTGSEAGRNGLAVGRGVLSADGSALTQVQVIYRQTPKVSGSSAHYGGRVVQAADGLLFVTMGDRQNASERDKAQDLSAGHGKVVRITTDGLVPADNPFAAVPGAQAAIWSYGHRNPQGAAIHPATGELWTTEHGPQGGDELNRTRGGRNYGWPRVSHGCEYGTPVGNCTPVGGASAGAGYEPPVSFWVPTSIAPSGLVVYDGSRFPEWRGQVFLGALAGQALWRIRLDGDTVVEREAMFTSLNERIRDVRQGPDGWLYLLTDSASGRILRVQR